MLSQPSWSVRSLRDPSPPAEPPSGTAITTAQLHHLLRLAALPLPQTAAEEASMIDTLESQLQFVRAVRRVDTDGVEPLRAIRDETPAALRESTVGLADMQALLARDELVGHYKRPRRARERVDEQAERWDVLGTASRRADRYFVVQGAKTGGE